MTNLILTRQRDHIYEIIINRDDKRNALNFEMMHALDAAISEIEDTAGIRAVLIRGEGKGFSAGIDVTGFFELSDQTRNNLFPFTAKYQGVMNRIERCSVPVIALLHNYALGMGLELALACDIRIAAEGTRLGLPEALLGLVPDVGGTTRLTRLIGPARAKEYIMTGREFALEDAERWGLVNHIVTQDQLLAKGEALAAELTKAAPLSVSYTKRIVDGLGDLERGLQLEAWAQSALFRSEDFINGAQAFLTKQPVEWKGR